MKILLPIAKDCEGELKLAQSFHNAQNVCIYDCKNDFYEWISTNTNIGDFSVVIKQRGIGAVITGAVHPLVLRIFSANGLQVFKAEGNDLEQNINLFQSNKLNSFSDHDTSQIMGCGSSCQSCSTNCN